MTRILGWEQRLAETVQRHGEAAFAWGVSDCLTLAVDALEAVTGSREPLEQYLRYSTETGAARVIRSSGYTSVEDGFAVHFEDVPPALAQRGDLGVIERDGETAAGVFTGIGFAVRGKTGLLYEPITAVKRAFRTG